MQESRADARRVNSLGFASNVMLPARKASLGLKYFKEFSNRATVPGLFCTDFSNDQILVSAACLVIVLNLSKCGYAAFPHEPN